ncbi:MAG: HDOD domain-containing protein [Planctomycetota bacterium]|nr:MAG: HDOD domain-containing protein [Planctomycetota bacterium]
MTDDTSFQVLFVDDDQRVLSGLMRQLRSYRYCWDIQFAKSGDEALRILRSARVHVVVSDMRMPGMSGVEFLDTVRREWPGAGRIILSGQTDHREILKSTGSVHQFLQKPCTPHDLVRAIERCHRLVSLLDQPALRSLASAICSLPVVSESYADLLSTLDNDASDASQIASVIERDVGLAAKVLQLVNSAFFGLPRRIETVRSAVSLLGVSQLRAVALSGVAFDALDTRDPCGEAIRSLWASSFEIGRAAERLARNNGAEAETIEQSRLAGMLSLIGRAILIRMHPEHYEHHGDAFGNTASPLQDTEDATFGAPQQFVGGYALGIWAFEDNVVNAVTFQSKPELCELDNTRHPLSFVHLARCCVAPTALVERHHPSGAILRGLGMSEAAFGECERVADL